MCVPLYQVKFVLGYWITASNFGAGLGTQNKSLMKKKGGKKSAKQHTMDPTRARR